MQTSARLITLPPTISDFVKCFVLTACLICNVSACRNIIVDIDLFSDCDDAGALLLAATSLDVNLLGVNINSQSSFSVPIGARRPLSYMPFFDNWTKSLGKFASKLATHLPESMADAEEAWDPVELYRKLLAEAKDSSVTIASIGFLHNLSNLLNLTADSYSNYTSAKLVKSKVAELVVIGGDYPKGYKASVLLGRPLIANGPRTNLSFNLVTMLYAIGGLGGWFMYSNTNGYNTIILDKENRCKGYNV
ncbi:hypothetical protein LX36DRAFT_686305 [Colletotrichum falcatum]|nr:hypothetical protein LX36DRAFT_686305 [Colletotrichum falcatum]